MKPRLFLPAIISAVLLWAAYFPLNLGVLGFVALVPWLTLVRAPVNNRRRYFAAYLGGVVFFLLAVQWLRVAHPMMTFSWLGMSIVFPVFWVVGLWMMRRIDRLGVIPLTLSVPIVWVAVEYVRAHFPTGFPVLQHVGMYQMIGFGWYFLGYTQHEFLALIQIADLGGVYAVSFLVAAVNGLLCDWALRSTRVQAMLRWPIESTPRKPLAATVAVALSVLAAVGYGVVRLDHPAFAVGPRVAAIQGSMSQSEKNQKGKSLWAMYTDLHARALLEQPRPDLIVWPETCMAADWAGVAPGEKLDSIPAEFRKQLEITEHVFGTTDMRTFYPDWQMPKPHWHATTLFGVSGLEWEGGKGWKYNSAVLVGPRSDYLGRYDKMHLVPLGEYVPLKETFPWMTTFTPYKWDYSCRPGEHWTRFPLTTPDGRQFTFGCLICYEDSDPYLARQYVRTTADEARPVDFLVNISNDGWFDGTEEHEEHLAICRFRAIEARRSVVRAVNMGISAVIDPDGRVIALPAESWSASKKVEAVVIADVPIDNRTLLFARFGDWLPVGGLLIILFGVLAPIVRRLARLGRTT